MKMKKQLLGMSIILYGILLCVIGVNDGFWIPVVDTLPWDELGLIIGTIGLAIVVKNSKDIGK